MNSSNNRNMLPIIIGIMIIVLFVMPILNNCKDNDKEEVLEKMENIATDLDIGGGLKIYEFDKQSSCSNNIQFPALDNNVPTDACINPSNNFLFGAYPNKITEEYISSLINRAGNSSKYN